MSDNIKYRQLKAFIALLETGSFMAAAVRLAVTQPALSNLIKGLEQDVGVILFDRSTRACVPTVAGHGFYGQIKGSLEQLEESYRQVKELGRGDHGVLRIAALSSLAAGVMTVKLAEFHSAYPDTLISLFERTYEQVHAAVRQREVDLGIGSLLHPDPHLIFTPVFNDSLMLIVPQGHPLATKRLNMKGLDRYELVIVKAGPSIPALKMIGVRTVPTVQVEQPATALAMVRRQMGITVLPSSVLTDVRLDGLHCIPIPGPYAIRSLGIIQKRGSTLSPSAQAFSKMLMKDSGHVLKRSRK